MAKFDYIKTKSTADRLIKNFGSELTFSRETGESFDPATGTVTSTTTTYTADVVWTDFSKDEIDGTLVQRGDARLLVAGEPEIDDRVTKDGAEYRIIDTNPLKPGDINVMTIAQARQ